MSSCSLASLQADACANGFLDLSEGDANAAILQLLYNVAGETATLSQLQTQSCSNYFLQADKGMQEVLLLQLLCNVNGGVAPSECVNLIPDDAQYDDDKANYDLSGLLTVGEFYSITWGENEDSLTINAATTANPGAGTVTIFSYDEQLDAAYLSGNGVSIPVTATICQI